MLSRLFDIVVWQSALAVAISVLVHEVGHAGVQRIFKLPVKIIEWGRGPRILKIGVLEIRLLPFAGGIYPNGSELSGSRIAGALIAAGGILAQWIGMVVIGRLQLHEIAWLKTFCIAYGMCAFLSLLVLIPFKGSDGYYLFKALVKRRQQV
ncbi:site-2 protease family protein [Cohnella soli]|uniref:Site-2 protease family protein n=1 Tax=Cohnella soli TaxID=425005 RepID=A0ABW0HV38_9BACL